MERRALVLFTRLPCEGEVFKSRLGKEIGDQEAANALAKALIHDLLAELQPRAAEYDVVVFYQFAGDDAAPCISSLADEYHIKTFLPQKKDGDVEQMADIFQTLFAEGYAQVIIVGTDIPQLNRSVILEAFEQLDAHDAVILPAMDKGYCLVGMRRYVDLFTGITNWQSRSQGYDLVSETKALADRYGCDLAVMGKTFIDIDYLDDIRTVLPKLEGSHYLVRFLPLAGHMVSYREDV